MTPTQMPLQKSLKGRLVFSKAEMSSSSLVENQLA
eukprot:CAMPEP_0114650158 /NCGR_PEP_ID=MMETSP0191-20121206/7491_1 /TAXON_ID=126664 /ORGANISM="Sorites sp." /LENGTH=34 /DNA_ID= /DNA_START= /DNA_END= /DNA_ORIENTATION=